MGAKGRGNALHHARVHVRAFRGGDVDPHARAAEDERALELAFGDHAAYAKAHAVEHKIRVVGIAVRFYAHVGDRPALFLQVRDDGFLERKACEVRADQ